MSVILSRRVVGVTSAFAALSAALYTWSGAILPVTYYGTMAANKTMDLSKIGRNLVKKVPSMEEVPLESLWKEQTVVLTFLRRFG
jgi:hypothetical protein